MAVFFVYNAVAPATTILYPLLFGPIQFTFCSLSKMINADSHWPLAGNLHMTEAVFPAFGFLYSHWLLGLTGWQISPQSIIASL